MRLNEILRGRRKLPDAGRFYYHMTSSRNLPSIQKTGLLPGDPDRSNWNFGHEDRKVFFGKTYDQAKYYGDILKHGMSNGPAPENPRIHFVMLRVPANKLRDVQQDPQTSRDVYVERIVPPQDIQIEYGEHGWYRLLDVEVDHIAGGEWDDDEWDEEVEPEDDIGQLRAELVTLAQKRHPDKTLAEIEDRVRSLPEWEVLKNVNYYRSLEGA